MAAGTNNYFNIDYYWRGSNNVAMIINPAKTQQFGTGISDLNQLLAFIKSTFYLDDVVGFKANYNGVDYHGFWGVVITGGANEKMHPVNRWLEIHADTSGITKHFLNDAGLNTFGHTYINRILTTFPNRIKLISTSKSSFYSGSTRGYQTSVNGGAWYDQGKAYPAFSAKETVFSQDLVQAGAGYNDEVRVRSYITNEEGTYYSDIVTFFASDFLFSTDFHFTRSACDTNGEEIEVFMYQKDFEKLDLLTTSDQETGIYGYKDENFSIPLNDGWYKVSGNHINYFSFFVAGGQFRRRYFCNPAPTTNRIYLYFGGFDADSSCHWGDDSNLVYKYLYYQGDLLAGQTIIFSDEQLLHLSQPGYYSDTAMYMRIGSNGMLMEIDSCR